MDLSQISFNLFDYLNVPFTASGYWNLLDKTSEVVLSEATSGLIGRLYLASAMVELSAEIELIVLDALKGIVFNALIAFFLMDFKSAYDLFTKNVVTILYAVKLSVAFPIVLLAGISFWPREVVGALNLKNPNRLIIKIDHSTQTEVASNQEYALEVLGGENQSQVEALAVLSAQFEILKHEKVALERDHRLAVHERLVLVKELLAQEDNQVIVEALRQDITELMAVNRELTRKIRGYKEEISNFLRV